MAGLPVRSYSVSAIVLRKSAVSHEILLLQRNHTLVGTWCQVAGKIEPDETAWQAALREIQEETGLIPETLYSADICEQFYEPDLDAVNVVPVFVAIVDETQEVLLNDEHSAFEWLSMDEAIKRVPFAGQRHVLRHVEQEFILTAPNPWLVIQKG
jgi:dATP pyrophosphohydrolase